jgi:hypothetical protein
MSQTADVATWVERHNPDRQSQIRWFADRVHAADVTGEVGEMRWAGAPPRRAGATPGTPSSPGADAGEPLAQRGLHDLDGEPIHEAAGGLP